MYDSGSVVVPRTSPVQMSVANGTDAVRLHSTVMSFMIGIIGASLSFTVTICVHSLIFPLMSIVVQVTFVTPRGYVANPLFTTEAIVQLSSVIGIPKSTPEAEHAPISLLTKTSAGQVITGATVSMILTIAKQLAEFPFPSFTVSIMLFAPRSAHVNVVIEAEKVTNPQLSVEPASKSAGVMEASPVPSKYTFMF